MSLTDRKGMNCQNCRASFLATLVCIYVLLVLLTPFRSNAQAPKKKGGRPPAVVKVETVLEKEVISRITMVGTGEPWLQTVVASEEAGIVSKMLVEEGDQVKKDQIMCEQDTSQLKLKIEASKAELAEATVLQSQAQRDWERQKRLFDINSVSEKAFEDARFKVDGARKKVARLRANLRSLEDQLSKKQIKAPVSGYVVKRHCLVGQWLGEGNDAITIVVPDPILLMLPVPERYVSAIKRGDQAEVTFDALPGLTFKGVIDAVILRADEAARTFPVRIKIPNPDGVIKPGMLGRANLPVGERRLAILVPKDALVLSGTTKAVFVVVDQTARVVPVETGSAYGPLIEVKGDLKPGQQVVVRGNEQLRPGQPLQIIPGG